MYLLLAAKAAVLAALLISRCARAEDSAGDKYPSSFKNLPQQ